MGHSMSTIYVLDSVSNLGIDLRFLMIFTLTSSECEPLSPSWHRVSLQISDSFSFSCPMTTLVKLSPSLLPRISKTYYFWFLLRSSFLRFPPCVPYSSSSLSYSDSTQPSASWSDRGWGYCSWCYAYVPGGWTVCSLTRARLESSHRHAQASYRGNHLGFIEGIVWETDLGLLFNFYFHMLPSDSTHHHHTQ